MNRLTGYDMGHMTRRHLTTLTLLLVFADAVASAAVFLGVSIIRFESSANAVWSVGVTPGAASILFAMLWSATAWSLGLYRLRARWSLIADARDVARATLAVAALTLSSLFVFHQDDVSRLFLGFLFLAQPVSATVLRGILRSRFEALGRQGRASGYMVIAGTGSLAESFADQIERHPTLGIRVIGHLTVPMRLARSGEASDIETLSPRETSRPVLGSIDQMHDVFRSYVIDEVGVCLPPASAHYLEPIVAVAADEGKTVRVPRDLEEGVLRTALSEEFEGFLVRSIVHDGQRELGRLAKRVFDCALAVAALVILSPLWVTTAAMIRLRDGSPVLFTQTRIGLHGRPFRMLKFRSMEPNAEDRLGHLATKNQVRGPAFKIADDPRITELGAVLRKFSLDEVPQLLNVLRGDMSLVGPRPALPEEVAAYDIWHRRRLSVRPGMTGLWQVTARSEPDFDQRAELDLRYIDQWTFWMDLGILIRTVPALVTPRGQ